MPKCKNCGTDFDGKFCPNCGTKWQPENNKSCPYCGATIDSNAKFCTNCGQILTSSDNNFYDDKTIDTVETINNDAPTIYKVYNILKYVPAILFALFSVLLFIFFSAPVAQMPAQNIFGTTISAESYGNLYSFTNKTDGILTFIPELNGGLQTLFVFAIISVVFAIIYLKKIFCSSNNGPLPLSGWLGISLIIYLLFFIIACVISSSISSFDDGANIVETGACINLIIAFSLVIAIISIIAVVIRYYLYKKYFDVADHKNTSYIKKDDSQTISWVATHKKTVAGILFVVIVVIVLICLIPTFLSLLTNGTYYYFEDGDYNKNKYITLDNGDWADESGSTGTYEIDGDKITFYIQFFGISEELYSGTIIDGVITVEQFGIKMNYCKDGKVPAGEHIHNYTYEVIEPTCTERGYTLYTCTICGATAKDKYVETIDHYYSNSICIYCGKTYDGLYLKDVTKSGEVVGYSVSGIGTVTDTNLIIPSVFQGNPITQIDSSAFKDCTSLTSITIPDSVTSIGNGAFYNCTSLTSVTIPDSVTFIGSYTFRSCTSLTSVTIPDSVTYIGSDAFYNCSSLKYNEFDNAYYLGNDNNPYVVLVNAMDNKNCAINENTKIICDAAFKDCSSLTNVTIGDSVTYIGSYAFYGCSRLTSVTIGDSVTYIGSYAFYGCTSLTTINYNATYAYLSGNYVFAYAGKSGNGITVNIGSNVTEIPAHLFYPYNDSSYSPKIISVVFAENSQCTSIGNYAFSDCSKLTSVTIPDSVTYIGEYAFYNCTALTSVTIGNGVTYFGDYAFYWCTSLTSVTIPDGVTYIGGRAFYNCLSLTSVTIGNGVTSIGQSAFYGCSSLTRITIPDSVTSIREWAFDGCSSLTSVTIPDGVTYIGEKAFRNCTSLARITIPDSVTSIGNGAFYNCSSLTSVTFNGTKEQWNAITKGISWNNSTGAYTVHCTDGDIAKS